MFSDLHKRAQKAGQPPGMPIYTGSPEGAEPQITVMAYDADYFYEKTGTQLNECLPAQPHAGVTWIHIDGLRNMDLVDQVANHYGLHPLTVEDILNVAQRPKVEEFAEYYFITLKCLLDPATTTVYGVEQISLVLGKNFVISWQERNSAIFASIRERLRNRSLQQNKNQSNDYLFYRLIDTIVDQYFVVLEKLGDQIEEVEERVVSSPTTQNSKTIYQLKRRILTLRKVVWPLREVVSHLLQVDEKFITVATKLYLRDVYDHIVQAMDTLETFRDIMSGLLDVYLSSLTNRMNEIMKVLTVISTIFIPITFIASFYGMNFQHMPELDWRWGYATTVGIMVIIAIVMILFFRKKKWL